MLFSTQEQRRQQRLTKRLQQLIKRMQKVQRGIASQSQPASFHEIEQLKRLGLAYSATLEQLTTLNTANERLQTESLMIEESKT